MQMFYYFLFFSAGVLVDKTGRYLYVYLACSIVVATAAVFLMVSFYWLDRRDREASKKAGVVAVAAASTAAAAPDPTPDPAPDPARLAVDVVPGCQYSSVPTEGDRDKASANREGYVSSL